MQGEWNIRHYSPHNPDITFIDLSSRRFPEDICKFNKLCPRSPATSQESYGNHCSSAPPEPLPGMLEPKSKAGSSVSPWSPAHTQVPSKGPGLARAAETRQPQLFRATTLIPVPGQQEDLPPPEGCAPTLPGTDSPPCTQLSGVRLSTRPGGAAPCRMQCNAEFPAAPGTPPSDGTGREVRSVCCP